MKYKILKKDTSLLDVKRSTKEAKVKYDLFGNVDMENIEAWRSQTHDFVVVSATSEDIMMYIIILYCCTPIIDVFSSFQDAIIVYGF